MIVFKHQILLFFCLLALFSLFSSGYVYQQLWLPESERYSHIVKQTEQTKQELFKMMSLTEVSNAYSKVLPEIRQIDQLLSVKNVQLQLLNNISSLSKKYKLTIVSQDYDAIIKKDNFQFMTIKITINSSYQSLKSFLFAIQRGTTWTYVSSLKTRRKKNNQLTTSLKLVTVVEGRSS